MNKLGIGVQKIIACNCLNVFQRFPSGVVSQQKVHALALKENVYIAYCLTHLLIP